MRSLACSLLDGVLADAILISSRPPSPPTNIRKGRGRRQKYGPVTQKPFTSKWRCGDG